MLYLFSTKAALRKAMVSLSSDNSHFNSELIKSITNYLTDGGLSQVDSRIKAQEEIVLSLERQSKSLAEVIRAQEEESDRLSDGIVKEAVTLSDLGLAISEAESKLGSLGRRTAAEKETPLTPLGEEMMKKSSEFGAALHEDIARQLNSGAIGDWSTFTGTPESQ